MQTGSVRLVEYLTEYNDKQSILSIIKKKNVEQRKKEEDTILSLIFT